MSDQAIAQLAMILAPLMFVGFWLIICFLLPKITKWERLEELFPDRPGDRHIERYRFQALYIAKPGSSGAGLSYRGCVTLDACETGLRVSIWKVILPFSKPILIPWGEIETSVVKVTGFKMCGLKAGQPQPFTLSIIARIARRIADATNGRLALPEDLA